MPYGSILSLIDVELERLRAARSVLLEEVPTPSGADRTVAGKPADRTRLAEMQADSESVSEEPAQLHATSAAVVATALPPRQRRAYAPRRAKPAPAEPRALASTIPQGPVAISADALAKQRAVRTEEAAAAAKVVPFTPAEGGLDGLLRELQARANGALSAN